jgi:capsular exopolysaccharide synthesis family protein
MKFDNTQLTKQEEEINLKKILYLLLANWYWLLIFGILGLGLAYTYLQFKKPVYSMSSTILIPEESKGFDMKDLFDVGLDQDYTKINNQIEILKSSFTIKETLLRLNWRTSWFKKKAFLWNGIYKSEPFDVQEAPNYINPSGIKIYITPTTDNYYMVSVDGKLNDKGEPKDVSFEEKGEFGRPFKNDYFNFTLLKKVTNFESDHNEYYFVFNDLKQTTRAYQDRLNATLKDEMSDIVVCTIAGEEPNKECDFLNELITVYISQKMDLQNEAQRRSLEFINAQLSGISDSLNIAGDKFTEFRSKNTIINLGEEGTLVMNNLKEIESEKARSQIQLDYFQNVLSYLEDSGDLTKIVSPSVVGIQDAALNMLVVKLGDLYNRRQVISFSAKPNNPTLVMLDKELSQTRNRLNENLRNLIANAQKTINSLKEQQNRVNYQLNKLPAKEQQMINIQRQYNITNEIYNFLLQKRAETNIALASSISDVQIIETADPDMAKSIGMARMMILYVGLFLGLVLPSVVIFILNTFDNRIHTQDDIENNTQLPIVGNIMHSTDHSDLTVFMDPKSNIAESFRELRTNLEFMLTGTQSKVISIHSTNPGEGKSYNSINLGTILAMNDNKVLIVGTDMRKPKLHKIFNIDNSIGLSTCLIGYDTFKQVVFPTQIENLSVLPSGPIPPNPAEILSKPAMKDLIEWARKQYNYVILDNAPVALVTDGIIVSRLSDLNIFVLRFGMSHKHQLELINQFAETKKVNDIGIIVNDIKANSLGKGYYKYYQYEAYKKAYYSDEEKVQKARRKKKDRA